MNTKKEKKFCVSYGAVIICIITKISDFFLLELLSILFYFTALHCTTYIVVLRLNRELFASIYMQCDLIQFLRKRSKEKPLCNRLSKTEWVIASSLMKLVPTPCHVRLPNISSSKGILGVS